MNAGDAEAARLRRCRELFERAATANVTLDEQRRQEATARWQAADRRLADRRTTQLEDGRELQWFQK